MRRFQAGSSDPALLLSGATTDSGGGGTLKSFVDALFLKEGVTCEEGEYLQAF